MKPIEKARRILMAECGECWADHNCQCDRTKLGEWIAIPVRIRIGLLTYFRYMEFHAARVKRAVRLGLLEEVDIDM